MLGDRWSWRRYSLYWRLPSLSLSYRADQQCVISMIYRIHSPAQSTVDPANYAARVGDSCSEGWSRTEVSGRRDESHDWTLYRWLGSVPSCSNRARRWQQTLGPALSVRSAVKMLSVHAASPFRGHAKSGQEWDGVDEEEWKPAPDERDHNHTKNESRSSFPSSSCLALRSFYRRLAHTRVVVWSIRVIQTAAWKSSTARQSLPNFQSLDFRSAARLARRYRAIIAVPSWRNGCQQQFLLVDEKSVDRRGWMDRRGRRAGWWCVVAVAGYWRARP